MKYNENGWNSYGFTAVHEPPPAYTAEPPPYTTTDIPS
jgi:hypothetical protein